MRLFAIFAFVVAALISVPAQAAWVKYDNTALGYSVTFPGQPEARTGIYSSHLAPRAPVQSMVLKEGDATYSVIVIDTGRLQEGAILMGEFEYWLGHFGDIVVNTIQRLNAGMEYGRFYTIDCRDNVVSDGPLQNERARKIFADAAGLTCPNGARLTMSLHFTQGRLYAVTAVCEGPDAKLSGAPARFVNSLSWIAGNLEHANRLMNWSAVTTAGVAPTAPGVAPAGAPPAGMPPRP
jgi:hypothetical protein